MESSVGFEWLMTLYIGHTDTDNVGHSQNMMSVCKFTFLLDVSNLGLLNALGRVQGFYPWNNMDFFLVFYVQLLIKT